MKDIDSKFIPKRDEEPAGQGAMQIVRGSLWEILIAAGVILRRDQD
jgi:hypothetical protein